MGKISDNGIEVNCLSIDYFVLELKNYPPQLIKIDVEGAEYSVLKGSNIIIMKSRPIIFFGNS
ncbi:MAG: FkbM family methyltransferase [Verrucomicrobiia bacterium]|jgi:FkbM family methyltransferase